MKKANNNPSGKRKKKRAKKGKIALGNGFGFQVFNTPKFSTPIKGFN